MTSEFIEANVVKDDETELQTLFAEMEEGYTVSFKRTAPDWCKGSCGTYDWDPDEPISMEWIEENLGGVKYQVTVKDSRSKYIGSRRVRIPCEPKKNGVKLMRGPNGYPIKVNSEEAKQLNGKPQNNTDQQNDAFGALKTMFELQMQQNTAIQTVLTNRVSQLEKMLTQKINEPAQLPQPHTIYDPSSQFKTILETMRMIDELRDNVRSNQDDSDNRTELYNKMLEKVFDKLTESQIKSPVKQHGPPMTQPPQQISDLQLMAMVKSRLDSMPEHQKDDLIQQFLGEDFEIESADTSDHDTRQAELKEVDSLLTDEDQRELDNDSGAHTDPAKLARSDASVPHSG